LSTSEASAPGLASANVTGVLMEGIVSALSERSHLTQTQRQARAGDVWGLISEFEPRDPLQIMLIGQSLMFNELTADAARDVLRGIADIAIKSRVRSNVIALNRTFVQNLSMFLRVQDKSVAAEQEEVRIAAAPPLASAEPPAEASAPTPVEEGSWLDEPTTTWVMATPGQETTRESIGQAAGSEAVAPDKQHSDAVFNAPRRNQRALDPDQAAQTAESELIDA
jgi:hypothetical protein